MRRALVLVLVLLGVVLVVAAGAEILGPPVAERAIERRVAERLEVQSVDARLEGFPVVPRLLATGKVARLDVDLRGLVRPELTIDTVRVRLAGIELVRGSFLDGEPRFERIDRGEVEAEITEDELEAALPGVAGLRLTPGRATVDVAGVAVDVGVSVSDGALRLDLGPLPAVSLPLPTDILPCPLDGEVLEGRVRLSCTLDEVPDWVLREANRSVLGASIRPHAG